MSSYIIEKEDYIKFAGLLVGLEETKKIPHTYYLKSIRYKCAELYEKNVMSVCEERHDMAGKYLIGTDEILTEDTIFAAYRLKGIKAAKNQRERKKVVLGLKNFIASISYQTAVVRYAEKTQSILFWIWQHIDPDYDKCSTENWGKIDI